jgi:hypothetical protein
MNIVADIRGGPQSADHVDILGNQDLTEDVLRIVANHPVEGRIHSNILSASANVAARIRDM